MDFIGCVAFGKRGEFAEKYFKKGKRVSIAGRLQVSSWEDKEGKKRQKTEVIIEEQYFADGNGAAPAAAGGQAAPAEGFYPVDEDIEDDGDLPF